MLFKDISYLQLWWPSCLAERNHLGNLGRGHYKENFCEMILNLDKWFKRKCHLKIFLIYSSGCHLFFFFSFFGRGGWGGGSGTI